MTQPNLTYTIVRIELRCGCFLPFTVATLLANGIPETIFCTTHRIATKPVHGTEWALGWALANPT